MGRGDVTIEANFGCVFEHPHDGPCATPSQFKAEIKRGYIAQLGRLESRNAELVAAVQAALNWIVPVYEGLIGGLDDITRSVGANVKPSLPVEQHPTVVQLRNALRTKTDG